MEKLNTAHIKDALAKEGYLPLSNYVNSWTKIDMYCPKTHLFSMRWNAFQRGQRCPECAKIFLKAFNVKKGIKSKQKSLLKLQELFQKEGYLLLSEYKNCRSKLRALCPKGHECSFTGWGFIKKGYRCEKCTHERYRKAPQQIIASIEQEGYIAAFVVYENAHTKFTVTCPKGHIFETCWNHWQNGHRCALCQRIVSNGERQLGKILELLFPDRQIIHQDNLGFLGLQKVDYSVRELGLAFEYDGQQHFRPVSFMGGEEGFQKNLMRDKRKEMLCEQNNIRLVRIPYTENMSAERIKEKITDKVEAQNG